LKGQARNCGRESERRKGTMRDKERAMNKREERNIKSGGY
jgi:hypothetical protein